MSSVDVTLRVKNAEFRSGLEQAKMQMATFKADIAGKFAGLFAAGAIISAATAMKSLASEFGRVQDIADKFGESAESLQRLDAIGAPYGADIEKLATALQKATVNASKAAQEGGNLDESFKRLGINSADFVNLSLENKLIAISKGMMNVEGAGDRLRLAVDLLGKSGGDLIPLLSQGPDALRESLEQANVATDATVAKLDELDDRLNELARSTKVELGGAIIWLADRLTEASWAAQALWAGAKESAKQAASIPGKLMDGDFAGANQARKDMSIFGKAGEIINDTGAELSWQSDLKRRQQEKAKSSTVANSLGAGEAEAIKAEKEAAKEQAKIDKQNEKEAAAAEKEAAKERAQADQDAREGGQAIMDAANAREEAIIQMREDLERSRFDNLTKEQQVVELMQEAKRQLQSDPGDNEILQLRKATGLNEVADQIKGLLEGVSQKIGEVDMVRGIGGSLAGVNYSASVNLEGQKQTKLQQEAVNFLKSIDSKEWKVEIPVAK